MVPAREQREGKNPFFVLELEPPATRSELERQKNKLLALYEVKPDKAARYPTPWGERPRTADDIRAAAKLLEDPKQRLWFGLWAKAFTEGGEAPSLDDGASEEPHVDLLDTLGWW